MKEPSSNMVKEIMKKLVKLMGILEHFQRSIFKVFFNHDEGNDNETRQNEGHSNASLKVNLPKFHLTMVNKLREKISIIIGIFNICRMNIQIPPPQMPFF